MTYPETVTVQYPTRDEQRICLDLDYDGTIGVEVADDEDGTVIEMRMCVSEVERLIAKLSVKVAQARMAA